MVLETNLPIHSSTIRDFVAGTQYFLAELHTESVLQPVNKFTYRYMLSVFCLMILTPSYNWRYFFLINERYLFYCGVGSIKNLSANQHFLLNTRIALRFS